MLEARPRHQLPRCPLALCRLELHEEHMSSVYFDPELSDTCEQPKPQQKLNWPTLPYLAVSGQWNRFLRCAVHENGSPNTADVARYSIDLRTVHMDDVAGRRRAPNLDLRCTGTTMRDYQRASDLQHLPEDVVQMYDDCSATADQVLYFGDRLKAAFG